VRVDADGSQQWATPGAHANNNRVCFNSVVVNDNGMSAALLRNDLFCIGGESERDQTFPFEPVSESCSKFQGVCDFITLGVHSGDEIIGQMFKRWFDFSRFGTRQNLRTAAVFILKFTARCSRFEFMLVA